MEEQIHGQIFGHVSKGEKNPFGIWVFFGTFGPMRMEFLGGHFLSSFPTGMFSIITKAPPLDRYSSSHMSCVC